MDRPAQLKPRRFLGAFHFRVSTNRMLTSYDGTRVVGGDVAHELEIFLRHRSK